MLFKPTITLLLASLAAAAPASVEGQPQQDIRVWLNANFWAISQYVKLSTDGVAVAVDESFRQYFVSSLMVKCLDKCDQEYHCTLYDENLAAFKTVLWGTTRLEPPKKVYQVSCKAGLPLEHDLKVPITPAPPSPGVTQA